MKKCKSCQSEIDQKATKCPHCQTDQRNWFARHPISTVILVLIVLFIIGSAGSSKSNVSTSPSADTKTASVDNKAVEEQKKAISTPIPATSTPEPIEPAKKVITYEILQRWSIPNGGEGKVILISKEYLNEQDMTALGEKLKNDTARDRNAFISVFTDKKAAALRDKVLADELSDAEMNFYDINYVGQYNKNGNTGFHEFAIYFDGVMGTNNKTIDY